MRTSFPFRSILFGLALFSIGLLMTACQSESKQTETTAVTKTVTEKNVSIPTTEMSGVATMVKQSIHAPFEKLTIAAQTIKIKDPHKAQTLRLNDGAYIKVPANAFATASGELITGEITISYKDFHNVAEIIASGIPMKVANEDGTMDWMQTGGMFEIEGRHKGQTVQLVEGKEMEVSFVSTTAGNFDFWSFDKNEGNWKNIASDQEALPEKMLNKALKEDIQQLQRSTAKRPIDPASEQAHNLIFTDLNVDKCPSLKDKSSIILTYAGTDAEKHPKENQWITKPNIWFEKELTPLDEAAGTYTLSLYGKEMYSIPVKLGLTEEDLGKAKARYKTLMANYQNQLALLKDKTAIQEQQVAFRRTIELAEFGIYNYDIIWKQKEAIPFAADFNFGAANNIFKDVVAVYMVTGDNRVVVSLPQRDWDNFRFNPNTDNKVIAVLPDDKIALFSQHDFKQEAEQMKAAKGQEYVFNMRIAEGRVQSVEDLQALIDDAS